MNSGLISRAAIAVALAAAVCAGASGEANAQAWPQRPVKIIVAYPPGGTIDITARTLAEPLREAWGQPVVVENRGGASGTIGADAVAKSPADGYTLLMAALPEIAIAKVTFVSLAYDPARDFAPISLVARSPFVMVVNAEVPAKNLQEFVALAKREPGKLNYGTSGAGTTTHFVAEFFRLAAGIELTHVPYRGSGQMMSDLLANHVQLAFDTLPTVKGHIEAGKLRAIGAAMAKRSPAAPDIPTFDEQGLTGFVGGSWVGLLAPAGTPQAALDKAEAGVRDALARGAAAILAERGLEPAGTTGAEFRAFIAAESTRWAEVAQRAGIKAE